MINNIHKQTELYNAYQYSTAWGVFKNKIQPSLQSGRGRDLFTHYMKAYPSKWTKKGHDIVAPYLYGKKKKRDRRRKESDSAVKVLEGMLRGH